MQINTTSYYSLLNVPVNASPDDIKKAFRLLAHRFHPDKNPGDKESEEKFKEISRAYEVLNDPQKRLIYDRTGIDNFDGMPGGMGGHGMGCGRRRGCGRGRFRGDGSGNFFKDNYVIYDIAVSRKEALNGIQFSVNSGNGQEEIYSIRLPGDVENGTVLRYNSGNGGNDLFVRINYTDE